MIRVWLSPEGELVTDNPAGLAELRARPVAPKPEPACDDCGQRSPVLVGFVPLDGHRGAPLTLCGPCARALLPAAAPAETAPARRPGRKRTRQAGG